MDHDYFARDKNPPARPEYEASNRAGQKKC
jgi:hypothetical protein